MILRLDAWQNPIVIVTESMKTGISRFRLQVMDQMEKAGGEGEAADIVETRTVKIETIDEALHRR